MKVQVIYDNGNYETFDTPPMSFEEGRYTVENSFLKFAELLFARSEDEMCLPLERCYWTVEDEDGSDDDVRGYQVDVPANILERNELTAILAIIVDGICMIARCEGKLRSWLDPEFENPMIVGFDVERMTGGWAWPKTMSVSRPEGANFKPYKNDSVLQDTTSQTTPDGEPSTENSEVEPEISSFINAEEQGEVINIFPGSNDTEEEEEDF